MIFNLEILSPVRRIFSGEVTRISLPSTEGVMSALARHMPIVTPLTTGEVEVKTNGSLMNWSIGRGVFFVSKQNATLLIEDVTSSDEISEGAVIAAKEKAESIIKSGVVGEEKLQAMYALRKSLVDLKIIRKKRKITATL